MRRIRAALFLACVLQRMTVGAMKRAISRERENDLMLGQSGSRARGPAYKAKLASDRLGSWLSAA